MLMSWVLEIGYIRVECSSYKKTLGKAINVSLTNYEFSSGNHSDFSSYEKCLIYLTFASVIKSQTENVEDLEENNSSKERSNDERDKHDAYDQLFKESLKLKNVIKPVCKKLHDLELENEILVDKLEESTKVRISWESRKSSRKYGKDPCRWF